MIRPTCPICGKSEEIRGLEDWPYLPFCSRKCKTIDLGRWIDGTYVNNIPVTEPDEEEAE